MDANLSEPAFLKHPFEYCSRVKSLQPALPLDVSRIMRR